MEADASGLPAASVPIESSQSGASSVGRDSGLGSGRLVLSRGASVQVEGCPSPHVVDPAFEPSASSEPELSAEGSHLSPSAEDLASSALERHDFSERSCVSILPHAFQRPVLNGGTLGHALETDYFCIGLFHNRSVWGLTAYCRSTPAVVRCLNASLAHYAPTKRWYAIAVSPMWRLSRPELLQCAHFVGPGIWRGAWIAQEGGTSAHAVPPGTLRWQVMCMIHI